MPNNYCDLSDVKDTMPDGNWGGSYDTILGLLCGRASRALDRYTKREPGFWYVTADTTRYFTGSGCGELWIGHLADNPTSVSVAESGVIDSSAGTGGTYTAWSASDYLLWPYNAEVMGQPYRRLDIDAYNGTKAVWYKFPKSVKIVGKFGWATAVPADVKMATVIQAGRWFKRGQQAWQDTGAIVELGQLTYTQQLDPDIAALVAYLIEVTI